MRGVSESSPRWLQQATRFRIRPPPIQMAEACKTLKPPAPMQSEPLILAP